MAFQEILAGDIESGDPVTQELFQKIKDSLDDHEDRIDDAEAAVQSFVPMLFKVRGGVDLYVPITAVEHLRIFNNLTLTGARIFVPKAGASGTIEVDVQYKRGASAFASIFSTKPTLAYSAGDYSISTNAVISVTDLNAGDILRLDVNTAQVGCEEFDVYLSFYARS